MRRFCKDYGPVAYDEKLISVEGTGAWKTLSVKTNSGKKVLDKKFYKTEFGELISDPEYAPYVNAVFNAAYAEVMGNSQAANLDTEAYEEVRQVALDIEDDEFVNPE